MGMVKPEACLISIRDKFGSERPPLENWHDMLVLTFLDTNDDFHKDGPDPRHAAAVVKFANENKGREFVVHCEQGVSRSSAVCHALFAMGWDTPAGFEGGRHANPLFVKYLSEELGETLIVPDSHLSMWFNKSLTRA